jgi:Tol biopolymer transport system component
MHLKTALLVAGGVASGAIALAATVVFTGSQPMARTEAPLLDAAAVEVDTPLPDPEAAGVIVAAADHYYYWLAPSGERGTLRTPPSPNNGISPDGHWQAGFDWDEEEAFLRIFDLANPDGPGNTRSVRLSTSLVGAEWAPEGSVLAALDETSLYLVNPASGEASLVSEGVTAYAWGTGDRLVFASLDASGARLSGLDERGQAFELAALAGPIDRFYVSPKRDQVLYTQDSAEGWRLLTLDPQQREITDYGNLGHAADELAVSAPDLAIAWSPDGTRLAVGPVSKPYVMHVVETADDLKYRYSTYSFEEGYAGEIAWSPDGAALAISTYSLDRTQHEVYVLEWGVDRVPRHLLDGCKIVWSPDGKFVAVKREPYKDPGLAVIRVDSGFHWPLTEQPSFIPLTWGVDEEQAVALAAKPLPYAIQLGK